MAKTLLALGATSAQADMNGVTACRQQFSLLADCSYPFMAVSGAILLPETAH
ncbi:hypothetical protein N657DRAFT_639067 [Parathielavia appendiculata]|uniref:Uncharacterized protein n=1 Tax=Parathielavia appendiculata TaxID=2587402 RepID=A0AAN6U8W3_9PEZI|nr:hypothetical protein N657DRAFT_639067 [Parathielavia appendiculata]